MSDPIVSQYTFGPWRVEESSHKQEFSHWIGSLSRHAMPRHSTIAGVVNAGAESEANARLIAAAPDLLAALRDALAELSPLMQSYRPEHYEAICGAARAAIAKAEGGAGVALCGAGRVDPRDEEALHGMRPTCPACAALWDGEDACPDTPPSAEYFALAADLARSQLKKG